MNLYALPEPKDSFCNHFESTLVVKNTRKIQYDQQNKGNSKLERVNQQSKDELIRYNDMGDVDAIADYAQGSPQKRKEKVIVLSDGLKTFK